MTTRPRADLNVLSVYKTCVYRYFLLFTHYDSHRALKNIQIFAIQAQIQPHHPLLNTPEWVVTDVGLWPPYFQFL